MFLDTWRLQQIEG